RHRGERTPVGGGIAWPRWGGAANLGRTLTVGLISLVVPGVIPAIAADSRVLVVQHGTGDVRADGPQLPDGVLGLFFTRLAGPQHNQVASTKGARIEASAAASTGGVSSTRTS